MLYDSMDDILILSPQVLVRRCYISFEAESIPTIIKMHTMHPYSISIIFVGATLALIMLLLVWQPVSLHNITQVHVIPYY